MWLVHSDAVCGTVTHEQFLALYPTLLDTLPDTLLIHITPRTVDVPVPGLSDSV